MPRVVITGLGTVTALGWDNTEVRRRLLAGDSGVRTIQNFDHSHPEFKVHFAAEVDDGWFDPARFMNPKDVRRYDRYTQFGVAASRLALEDARLDPKAVVPRRAGVMIGSGIGGLETFSRDHLALIQSGPAKVSPFYIPASIANITAGIVAIETGWKGPCFAVVSACTSSTHQIGVSYRFMQAGMMDVCLAGGAEAATVALGLAGFQNMKALSTRNDDPARASRPFDAGRDGFVMGEGAAMVVLETLEHAQARGATILGEIVGFGASADAFHITQPAPEGEGAYQSMQEALADAKLEPSQIQYINAHGTSTPYNDKFETMAIKRLFGEHAHQLCISSTKSMIGHLLGASGAAELVATMLCLQEGMVHPTINYETPDPDCDLDYVPNTARKVDVEYFLSNSFGFGGQNGTLVVKKGL